MKKYALIIFIISLLMLFSGVYFTGILSALLPSTDIGIIGGADRPTVNFLLKKILNDGGLLVLFGLPTAFCSLFALIFSRPIKKHCCFSTSATALGLSACASLGAYSLLIFTSCFIMTKPSKHPIAFPASVGCGMIALIGFILLMALYCKLRGKKPSALGVFFDVAFSLMYMPTFFWSYNILYNLLSIA
ncbi:MAG: hypothetical protein IKW18_07625 [Clostridia bacterium]|nr:hypothetical protein [Clostridia bacterium]